MTRRSFYTFNDPQKQKIPLLLIKNNYYLINGWGSCCIIFIKISNAFPLIFIQNTLCITITFTLTLVQSAGNYMKN